MVGVPARREQVAYAQRRDLSQRRSCTLLGVARSALRYRSTKAEKDAPVLARMVTLGRTVPALRLPANPHLPRSRGPCHELGPGLAAVEAGPAAGAPQATAQADRDRAAPPAGAHGR